MIKTTILFVLLSFSSSHVLANQYDSISDEPESNNSSTTNNKPEMIPAGSLKVNLLDFPRRGMSMRQVMNELGKPKKASLGIGTPPIRKWKYDDRTIYFENTTVIHVVATP